jgi:hypothetical protein
LGTPVPCQPATGGTSVTSGCGAKPAIYRNFSSACSSATRPLVEPTLSGLLSAEQERDNVGRGEVLDPPVLGHTLPQDRAGQLHVTHDRGLGQTSIHNKPPTVTLYQHLDRRRRCG